MSTVSYDARGTPFGLCSALKMNQWLGSGAAQLMAGKPAKARQNGRGI